MRLSKTLSATILALAMMVAVASAAKAKDSKDVLLHYDVTLAGSHLASGNYAIQWQTHSPEATVTFMQKGKVVATAEGKVVDRGIKYESNQVVYNITANGVRQIQEIRFRGSSEVIEFNP